MKVERENDCYKKITITLETREEADMLKTIMGSIRGGGDLRVLVNELYNYLGSLGAVSTYTKNIKANMEVNKMKIKTYGHSKIKAFKRFLRRLFFARGYVLIKPRISLCGLDTDPEEQWKGWFE